MKLLFPFLTLGLTTLLIILAQSSLGLTTADLYWRPNAWDLTIYSSETYLIPSRIFWAPLYLLPHRTYEGLSQAILFTAPYWFIASALPSALVYFVIKRLTKPKIIPPSVSTNTSAHSLPSEKSF